MACFTLKLRKPSCWKGQIFLLLKNILLEFASDVLDMNSLRIYLKKTVLISPHSVKIFSTGLEIPCRQTVFWLSSLWEINCRSNYGSLESSSPIVSANPYLMLILTLAHSSWFPYVANFAVGIHVLKIVGKCNVRPRIKQFCSRVGLCCFC
jgi:hypothetical protein